MLASLRAHTKRHSLVMTLSPSVLRHLQRSPCTFCSKNDTSAHRTYQNVGTKKFDTGFVDKNVFPLCKMCYRTRFGKSKKAYMSHANKVSSHITSSVCKTYRRQNCKSQLLCFPKETTCMLCGEYSKTTVDRINSKGCYNKANIQFLCSTCNRMKSNISQISFIAHMKHVRAHNFVV